MKKFDTEYISNKKADIEEIKEIIQKIVRSGYLSLTLLRKILTIFKFIQI